MKKIAAFTIAAGLLAGTAYGAVSFSLDIELLAKGDGTAITNQGLLALVVDTAEDGFSPPSVGALTNNDDQVVATWDLSLVGPGTSDITLLKSGVAYNETDWKPGNALALVWFPNLAAGATPGANEEYGFFTPPVDEDDNLVVDISGDSWKMPADETLLHSLKLFTASASKLVMFGDVPDGVGRALYAVGQDIVPSTAPAISGVSATGSSVTVTWTGTSSDGGFVVQRSPAGSGEWQTVGIVENGTNQFSDTGVKAGASYDYRLVAIDGYSFAASSSSFIQALRSRIIAFDSRGKMMTGVNKRNIDLTVSGEEDLPVLLQAIGPSLHASGSVPAARPIPADTMLEMYYGIKPADKERLIATNDDWDLAPDPDLLEDVMVEYGAYPMRNHPELGDAAFLAMVSQVVGGYTSPVSDPLGSEGIAVVGIYDVDYLSEDPVETRLTGVASRGFVGVGYENMRSSVNIVGDASMTLLIRAHGPWLRDLSDADQFTSETTLDNPTLVFNRLQNGSWVEVARNTDWGTGATHTEAEFQAAADKTGLNHLTSGSHDSAIMVTVEAGIYQAIVEGVDGETGVAQIAVFEVSDS